MKKTEKMPATIESGPVESVKQPRRADQRLPGMHDSLSSLGVKTRPDQIMSHNVCGFLSPA